MNLMVIMMVGEPLSLINGGDSVPFFVTTRKKSAIKKLLGEPGVIAARDHGLDRRSKKNI